MSSHPDGGATHTVLVPRGAATAESVRLSEEEARHLGVKRVATGSIVRWMDGGGHSGVGIVTISANQDAAIAFTDRHETPEPMPLVLGVGGGDRERFAWLAEKATELGVTHLYPLATTRSHSVATRVRDEHVEKMQRRALEAAKQSGNPWPVTVHSVCTIDEFMQCTAFLNTRMMADMEGHPAVLDAAECPTSVAIGPEGGFDPQERQQLMDGGYVPVSFGRHILRFETAAIAAASICQAIRAGFDIPS